MARTQVTRTMLADDARKKVLVFRIYDPSNRSEPLLINMPWDGTVLSAGWQVDTGSYDFTVDIAGTPIVWVTASGSALGASSTAAEDTTASAYTFSAGDLLEVDIGTVTGTPKYMQLELIVQIAEVDA